MNPNTDITKTLPAAIPRAVASPRSSAHRPNLVEGTQQRFTDVLTSLIRRRLTIASLVLALALLLALIPTWSYPGLPARLFLLVLVASCHVVLHSQRSLSSRQLRGLEMVVVGSFVVQALFMPDALMLERARAGDFVTVVMDRYFNTGAWALFVVMYGLFIRNTWQRALVFILPLSCIPDLNFYLLGLYEPRVQEAFNALHHGAPVPLMLLAGRIGAYGAHSMYAIRRDAFRAKQLGQYRLREKLGSGGMGEVYRAEHELLKRPCAIKLLRPDCDTNLESIARFEREVQATARLSHPNTVEIYDYGRTDEGVFYYVMELLEGLSLADLLRQNGPLPGDRAVYLLRQVCAALQEAHGKGLIHRDIKPSNIFSARRGGVDDVVKLLDFGLVKFSKDADDTRITRQGVISGSPAYMSPEQASGEDLVDPRSDIYSLGAVAYDLLAGQPPFTRKSSIDVIVAHARDPVLPPSLHNPNVPADLEAIILRCLQKLPEKRFADVATLEQALASCECAGQWNALSAARWWQARAESPGILPDAKESPPVPAASDTTRV